MAWTKRELQDYKNNLRNKTRRYLKQRLFNILAQSECARCGENNFLVLQFHHRNPDEKSFGIMEAILQSKVQRWDRIQAEIDKCDILCANCHIELEHINNHHSVYQFRLWLDALIDESDLID